MYRGFVVALLVAAVACGRRTSTPPMADAADRTAVRMADSAWNEASLSKTVDRMMTFYAPGAVADFPGSEPARGPAAIRVVWAQSFADTSLRLSWTMDRAEVLTGTAVAYTIGTWRQHTMAGDTTGPYFAVWQKQPDGRWLVLVDTAR